MMNVGFEKIGPQSPLSDNKVRYGLRCQVSGVSYLDPWFSIKHHVSRQTEFSGMQPPAIILTPEN